MVHGILLQSEEYGCQPHQTNKAKIKKKENILQERMQCQHRLLEKCVIPALVTETVLLSDVDVSPSAGMAHECCIAVKLAYFPSNSFSSRSAKAKQTRLGQ